MSLTLDYNPDDPHPHKWTATTANGNYDASGVDPLEAVTRLALVLEAELAEVGL